MRAAGWDTCFVINDERVLLGRLGRNALERDDNKTVETLMTAGPSTVHPSLDLTAALERMRNQNLTDLPVTRPDGVLIGIIRRDDAERGLAAK